MKRITKDEALISAEEALLRLKCAGPAWGCDGPERPYESMITCHKCQALHDVREALRKPRWPGWYHGITQPEIEKLTAKFDKNAEKEEAIRLRRDTQGG